MAALREKDRNAILLRFFQNKTLGEVGASLGASESAAKMRVNRALEKLRKLLSKRGVTLSTAVIAGAVSANSLQAAPPGLAATVTTTAAKSAAIFAKLTLLVKGTMKTMTWLKLKFAAGFVGTVLLASGAATLALSAGTADETEAAKAWRAVLSSLKDPPPRMAPVSWWFKRPTPQEKEKAFEDILHPIFLKSANLARDFYARFPAD